MTEARFQNDLPSRTKGVLCVVDAPSASRSGAFAGTASRRQDGCMLVHRSHRPTTAAPPHHRPPPGATSKRRMGDLTHLSPLPPPKVISRSRWVGAPHRPTNRATTAPATSLYSAPVPFVQIVQNSRLTARRCPDRPSRIPASGPARRTVRASGPRRSRR